MRYRDAAGRFAVNPEHWWHPHVWDTPLLPARVWLSDSKFALVDPEDYALVVKMQWSLHSDGKTKLYARCLRRVSGRRRAIYLHRVIAELRISRPSSLHTYVDHVNGDGLDCRRCNLRWATPRENRLNLRGAALRQGDLFRASEAL